MAVVRWIIFTIAIICTQVAQFLITFYYCYDYVYPGTKLSQRLNDLEALSAIKWSLAFLLLPPNLFAATMLFRLASKTFDTRIRFLAVSLLPIWFLLCVLVGTWGFWIAWPMGSIWHWKVWNDACNGWDLLAVLEGVSYSTLNSSLPYLGVVAVYLSEGNYTMELVSKDTSSFELYEFYVSSSFNYTPPIFNITYNTTGSTYTTNVSTHYVMSPNLAFPSLGLALSDPSIRFFKHGQDPPAADLIRTGRVTSNNGTDGLFHTYEEPVSETALRSAATTTTSTHSSTRFAAFKNRIPPSPSPLPELPALRQSSGDDDVPPNTTILKTITLSPSECTQLKLCGTLDGTEDFQVALGLVLIEQFKFGMCCTGGCGNAGNADLERILGI